MGKLKAVSSNQRHRQGSDYLEASTKNKKRRKNREAKKDNEKQKGVKRKKRKDRESGSFKESKRGCKNQGKKYKNSKTKKGRRKKDCKLKKKLRKDCRNKGKWKQSKTCKKKKKKFLKKCEDKQKEGEIGMSTRIVGGGVTKKWVLNYQVAIVNNQGVSFGNRSTFCFLLREYLVAEHS